MSREILRLDEVRKGDTAIAGGKGANLGEMLGKGFPVPPGFVVSASACQNFFRAIELEKEIRLLNDASPDNVPKQCDALRSAIENAELPSYLAEEILAAHEELVKTRKSNIVYAVRSSATAEDTGDASFAGQHGTYYYVDEEHLPLMIKRCWASLWSVEAVSYRSTQGIDHASVFMAVVVQEMILSEISGVTFTANPVTGSKDEIVIESSWGMGAAIVDGRVTPDRYVVSRDGLKFREKRIAEKRFMVLSRPKAGSKERLEPVPHEMRTRETLSPDLVRTIAEWSVKSEEHFGSPQDLEWAINDGHVYIVQSRPITAMGRKEIGSGVKGQHVLFKPLIENFTDPYTPLWRNLLVKAGPPGFSLIGGRLYIDIKYIRHLHPFKLSDEELANMLYLSSEGMPAKLKLSWVKLPFFISGLFLAYFAVGVLFARTRGMPDDFMGIFRKLCRKVEIDPAFGPFETLLRLWSPPKISDPLGNMPGIVNLGCGRYMLWMGVLKKFLLRWVPDLPYDAVALLCSGSEGVLSAEMGREIGALALTAKDNATVRKLLLENKPDKALSELKAEPEANEFMDQLNSFLAKNGHRAIKELELQSVRWEENPAPVLGMVRNYLLVESETVDQEKRLDKARAKIKAEIGRKLADYPMERLLGFRGRLIRFLTDRTIYFAKQRENSRFYHIMALYFVRKKIVEIEAEFLAHGKLKCKDDIFFLLVDEIDKLQSGELGWSNVEDRIRDRRMEHVRLSKMKPPKTIGIKMNEKPPEEPITGDEALLRGQSASPGQYEGLARVILDPSIDAELKPGEILVAPYTDPAWTPLFLTAGAAVVEVGSFLSHAGTVAREFGLPCVVDVSDCTRYINTGVRINVDADNGVVRILSEGEGDGE